MKITKLVVLLWISMHFVSCFEKPRYEKPINSLQLYISFEEPEMIFYGSEQELITLQNLINDASSSGVWYYEEHANKRFGLWGINFNRYFNKNVMKYGDYLNLKIDDITMEQDIASLKLRWIEELVIHQYEPYTMKILKTTRSFIFSEVDFDGAENHFFGFGFSSVRTSIIRAHTIMFDRPVNYDLSFKELERDEQGILFELIFINNKEIEA